MLVFGKFPYGYFVYIVNYYYLKFRVECCIEVERDYGESRFIIVGASVNDFLFSYYDHATRILVLVCFSNDPSLSLGRRLEVVEDIAR